MIELFQAANEIAQCFEQRRWEYAFIGGLAVLRWGDVRTTSDVDATLLTRYTSEEEYVKIVLGSFEARILDAYDFACTHRVLLVKASNGVAIDISLGGVLFEEQMIERSSRYCFSSGTKQEDESQQYWLRTCSAEDLVVLKAFADREKDWVDIDSILVRQRRNFDCDYVLQHLVPLCEAKENPAIVERFRALISRKNPHNVPSR